MKYRLIKIFTTVIIPFLMVCITIILSYPRGYSLLDRSKFQLEVYGDKEEGGSTEVSGRYIRDEGYQLNYTLKEGVKYPYANLYISLHSGDFIDFSGYDYIGIRVKSSSSNYLEVRVNLFVDGVSDLHRISTYVPFCYILEVDSNPLDYIVKIDDFKVPKWWYSTYEVNSSYNIKDHLKTVGYFQLGPTGDKDLESPDSIVLSGFESIRSRTGVVIIILSLLILYALSLYIIYNRNREGKSVITYTELEIEDNFDSYKIIEDYIGKRFSETEICLTKVSMDLGISSKTVSDYIHGKFKMNFPSFLNSIRVSEAKRILANHDIKIIDVAIAVGYSSPGHFNRIFKKFENMTPTEFRRKNRL